jgi:hypothetical protein
MSNRSFQPARFRQIMLEKKCIKHARRLTPIHADERGACVENFGAEPAHVGAGNSQ